MSVDIAIQNTHDLGKYAFTLTWDENVLQYVSVVNGSLLGSTGRSVTCDVPDFTANRVTFGCSSAGVQSGTSSDGVLATVHLQAIASGSSAASLSSVTLWDTANVAQSPGTADGSVDVQTGLQLKAGSYGGNGVDDRAITGLGFQPDVVLIASEGATAAVFRTSAMPGDGSKPAGDLGVLVSNLVQSLDGDGFTVGTDTRVNASGATYHWVAMKAGPDLAVGSYTGNGVNNRSITGVGFQPAWVMTLGNGADSVFRPADLAGTGSYRLTGFTLVTGRIQAVLADGFRVGSNNDVNQTGTSYYYIAWRDGLDLAAGTYTGTGIDNRSINGLGFQPVFVWIKREAGSASTLRPATLTGDRSLFLDATAASSNRIQAIEPDGFQVGTHITVNSSAETYHYLALKE